MTINSPNNIFTNIGIQAKNTTTSEEPTNQENVTQ